MGKLNFHCAQMCRCDIQTYCFGLAASMGAFLLGAGAKGKRYSMPNARIMIHQPLGGASGQARSFVVLPHRESRGRFGRSSHSRSPATVRMCAVVTRRKFCVLVVGSICTVY